MIFKVSNLCKTFLYFVQGPKFYGGGTPSTPTQTTQTVNQNSIPAELLPYVKTMMGAAENQVYTKNASGAISGLQPYAPYSTNAQDYIAPFSPLQQQAQTSAGNLQTPSQFAPASRMAGMSGMGQLATAGQALGYGAQGAGYGQDAANVGAIGGLGYGAQSADLGMQAAGTAGQGYGAGAQYAQQATDPNAFGAYMSPYMQNVMAQQVGAANRQYDISGAQQQGQATQAGAFGGSREALMASENERNRNTAIGGIYATGLQNAYTAANANQQFGANLNLQGMQAGNQAIQTGLQGIGQGITGVNTALQGYQQGMAGSQAGLQGVQGAQAGFTGAGQAAGTMGNLGQQQLAADTSIIGTQGQVGGQQQAQQQQAIDQSILDYKNAQQYPYMQLGTMSNLIRGIPMTNQTTTQYQAQPSMGSQVGGLAAAGLGAYAALKAEGGAIKDKGYATGGIVGYKDKGWVEENMMGKLEDLDKPHLQTIIQKNVSPVQTGLAKEVLATKLAKGGIVAFAKEGEVDDKMPDLLGDLAKQEDVIQEKINRQKAIKNTPITTNAADITPVQAATLGPMSKDESLKNMALNQAEGVTPPLQASGIKAVEAPSVADKVLAPVKATPFNLDQAMADQQQDVEKLRVDANKSEDELIADDRKRREKQLGPDTATADYRKKIMDERANAPDEARRQMGMRLIEFGANWASTPGAPLVAGMRALKEGLPGFMEDTKANKKAMKEIDASIYALEHADRLEQMGYLDRATAKKEKANELFMKAAPQVIDAGVKKQTLMQRDEEIKNQKDYQQNMVGVQREQNAETASYHTAALAQPTAAGMKEQAIKEVMKEKGVPYGAAYGIVEAYDNTTKDPTLGYEVAIAKSKYSTATRAAAELSFNPDSEAYLNAQAAADAALEEVNALQARLRGEPTKEDLTTLPSSGPRVSKTKKPDISTLKNYYSK